MEDVAAAAGRAVVRGAAARVRAGLAPAAAVQSEPVAGAPAVLAVEVGRVQAGAEEVAGPAGGARAGAPAEAADGVAGPEAGGAGSRPLERMNSPRERREIRLRGL